TLLPDYAESGPRADSPAARPGVGICPPPGLEADSHSYGVISVPILLPPDRTQGGRGGILRVAPGWNLARRLSTGRAADRVTLLIPLAYRNSPCPIHPARRGSTPPVSQRVGQPARPRRARRGNRAGPRPPPGARWTPGSSTGAG